MRLYTTHYSRLIIDSGENHSVREFIEKSFAVVGVEIAWSGEGVDEVGVCKDSGRIVVRVDPRYFRYVAVYMSEIDR